MRPIWIQLVIQVLFSSSFSLVCLLFLCDGIPKAEWDAKKYMEKKKKR